MAKKETAKKETAKKEVVKKEVAKQKVVKNGVTAYLVDLKDKKEPIKSVIVEQSDISSHHFLNKTICKRFAEMELLNIKDTMKYEVYSEMYWFIQNF